MISERWELCYRAPIAGFGGIDWTEKIVNFDRLADDIKVILEKNPKNTFICSDCVKQALEVALADPTRMENFAVISKALNKAEMLPEFDGINTREKLWVFGNRNAK